MRLNTRPPTSAQSTRNRKNFYLEQSLGENERPQRVPAFLKRVYSDTSLAIFKCLHLEKNDVHEDPFASLKLALATKNLP